MDQDHVKDLLTNEKEWRLFIMEELKDLKSELQGLRGKVAMISGGIGACVWLAGHLIGKFLDKI